MYESRKITVAYSRAYGNLIAANKYCETSHHIFFYLPRRWKPWSSSTVFVLCHFMKK